jgi:hypothetical protein
MLVVCYTNAKYKYICKSNTSKKVITTYII